MTDDSQAAIPGLAPPAPAHAFPPAVQSGRHDSDMASGFATGRDQRGRPRLAIAPCRSCRKAMLWVSMPGGKRNPLDTDPHPDGNIYLVEHANAAGEAWRLGVVLHDADLIRELRELEVPLYISHFATCPDADEHRREEGRRARRDLE